MVYFKTLFQLKGYVPPNDCVIYEWCEKLNGLYSTTYQDDQIKDDEMGGACNAHGKDEKCVQTVD
jgi:hypothetical protein